MLTTAEYFNLKDRQTSMKNERSVMDTHCILLVENNFKLIKAWKKLKKKLLYSNVYIRIKWLQIYRFEELIEIQFGKLNICFPNSDNTTELRCSFSHLTKFVNWHLMITSTLSPSYENIFITPLKNIFYIFDNWRQWVPFVT